MIHHFLLMQNIHQSKGGGWEKNATEGLVVFVYSECAKPKVNARLELVRTTHFKDREKNGNTL